MLSPVKAETLIMLFKKRQRQLGLQFWNLSISFWEGENIEVALTIISLKCINLLVNKN